MGILMTGSTVFVLYNTGDALMKWEYKTEVRLNALLQHHLYRKPYPARPCIHAVMMGTGMDMALRLLTSTGGYKKSLFLLDTSYEHFHYVPNNPEGEILLQILASPQIRSQLNRLLLSDLLPKKEDFPNFPIEHDALDQNGSPILLAYDFDLQRIKRFYIGLCAYDKTGNLICFDFQIPCLKDYFSDRVQFSSVDLYKVQRRFLPSTPNKYGN